MGLGIAGLTNAEYNYSRTGERTLPPSRYVGDDEGEPEVHYLTISDVAARLQVSEKTVRRMILREELPIVRWPGTRRILFDPADVDALRAGSRGLGAQRRRIEYR